MEEAAALRSTAKDVILRQCDVSEAIGSMLALRVRAQLDALIGELQDSDQDSRLVVLKGSEASGKSATLLKLGEELERKGWTWLKLTVPSYGIPLSSIERTLRFPVSTGYDGPPANRVITVDDAQFLSGECLASCLSQLQLATGGKTVVACSVSHWGLLVQLPLLAALNSSPARKTWIELEHLQLNDLAAVTAYVFGELPNKEKQGGGAGAIASCLLRQSAGQVLPAALLLDELTGMPLEKIDASNLTSSSRSDQELERHLSARLSLLDPRIVPVFHALALGQTPMDWQTLADATNLCDSEIDDALSQGVALALCKLLDAPIIRAELVSPWFARLIAASLPVTTRRRLHSLIARSLLRQLQLTSLKGREAAESEVAFHLGKGLSHQIDEEGKEILIRSAFTALDSRRFLEAEELFTAVRECFDPRKDEPDVLEIIYEGLSRAQLGRGDLESGISSLRALVERLISLPAEGGQLATVYRRLGSMLSQTGRQLDAMEAFANGIAALEGSKDDEIASTLRIQHGLARFWVGSVAAGRRSVEAAIRTSEEARQERPLLLGLIEMSLIDLHDAQFGRAEALAKRALVLAEKLDLKSSSIQSETCLGMTSFFSGNVKDAELHLGRSLTKAEALGELAAQSRAASMLAWAKAELGDLAEARRIGERAVLIDESGHRQRTLPRSLAVLAAIKARQGAIPEALVDLHRIDLCLQEGQGRNVQGTLFYLTARALVALEMQDYDEALKRSREAHKLAARSGYRSFSPAWLLPVQLLAAHRLDLKETTNRLIDEIRLTARLTPSSLSRPLVKLTGVFGAAELEDERALDETIGLWRDLGWNYWSALVVVSLTLPGRRLPPLSEPVLAAALRTFERSGASHRAAHLRKMLKSAGLDVARSQRRGSPSRGALTSREREIALLAASGLTNRQIAQFLWISDRTVTTHIERIYRKLAVKSRLGLGNRLGVIANTYLKPN
jgi:DNA-binding CsgD family transcriptional regulator/tetratricopeptide (TPR) repeat protein